MSKLCVLVTALKFQKAELLILQVAQHKNFVQLFEVNSGETAKQELAKPSPFVDRDNIMRLRCLLSNATINGDMKQPILRPAKQPAVVIIL